MAAVDFTLLEAIPRIPVKQGWESGMEGERQERKKGRGVTQLGSGIGEGRGGNYHLNPLLEVSPRTREPRQVRLRTSATPDKWSWTEEKRGGRDFANNNLPLLNPWLRLWIRQGKPSTWTKTIIGKLDLAIWGTKLHSHVARQLHYWFVDLSFLYV
jgi:hypothetical protein